MFIIASFQLQPQIALTKYDNKRNNETLQRQSQRHLRYTFAQIDTTMHPRYVTMPPAQCIPRPNEGNVKTPFYFLVASYEVRQESNTTRNFFLKTTSKSRSLNATEFKQTPKNVIFDPD